jgi:hypothetical protein
VTLVSTPVRPGEFCQSLLSAMLAAEGLVKRRGRNQTPDTIGLALKRDLLERAVADDPPPDAFESWLVAQVLATPAGGPVRAMCAQILDEYRLAALDPDFAGWLARGASSDDAEPRRKRSAECDCPPMDLHGERGLPLH